MHYSDPPIPDPPRSTWLVHREGSCFRVRAAHLYEAIERTGWVLCGKWPNNFMARNPVCEETQSTPTRIHGGLTLVGLARVGMPTGLHVTREVVCVWRNDLGNELVLHGAVDIPSARKIVEATRREWEAAGARCEGLTPRDLDFPRYKSGPKKGEIKWPRPHKNETPAMMMERVVATITANRHAAELTAAELTAAEQMADEAEALLEQLVHDELWARPKPEWSDDELAAEHARLTQERGTSREVSSELYTVQQELARRETLRAFGFDVGERVIYRMPVYGLAGLERHEDRHATVLGVELDTTSRGYFNDDPDAQHRRVVKLAEPFTDPVSGEAITQRSARADHLRKP